MTTKVRKHLLLTLLSPNAKDFTEEKCVNFLNDLVRAVDMVIFMPPRAKHSSIEGEEGTTGDVVITTSHATIHAWDKSGEVYLDLFSCKDFSSDTVVEIVAKYFPVFSIIELDEVTRGSSLPSR